MKRIAPQTLAAVGVVALLAVVAVLTAPSHVAVVESFDSTDFSGGGYRAWTGLLQREGVATARFVLRPIELDDRIDTLVSAQPMASLTDDISRTPADLAALAAWIRGGGRLMYLGRNTHLSEAETRLLDLPFFLPDVGARAQQTGPLVTRAGPLTALGANRMLLAEHSGVAEVLDGNGEIVVRYPLGRGEIVAVTDAVPFTNANIVAPGNARLAYLLAVPHRRAGIVAFDDGVRGVLRDRPWYRALPLPVRVCLAFLGLAGLLALSASNLRSAPPVRLDAPREPTSAEFIEALAALHRRIGARSAAASVLRRAALATITRGGGRKGADAAARLVDGLLAPVTTDAALLASAQLAYIVRKEGSHGGPRDGRRTAFASRTRARGRR